MLRGHVYAADRRRRRRRQRREPHRRQQPERGTLVTRGEVASTLPFKAAENATHLNHKIVSE